MNPQSSSTSVMRLNSSRWKYLVLLGAGLIAISSLAITNILVLRLASEERKKIELWAEGIRRLSNLDSENQDFTFIFQVVQNNTSVPVALADEDGNILAFRNIPFSSINTPEKSRKVLSAMKNYQSPIVVHLPEGKKHLVYYSDSTTLKYLTYYPYILLTVLVLFLGISYYAFSQSRKSEQDRVWVGLAKETAHQLGTPISSLLACIDMVKDGAEYSAISAELEKDIRWLEKIADRFSKIGSIPVLEPINLISLTNRSIEYLSSRSSSKISFKKLYDESEQVVVPLNEALFEWVIENIVKNAIDAIRGEGEITLNITDNIQVVYLDITDNGKGLPRSMFKTIFQPGFTTKSRGWGLGLTLSRRIIEEYHRGKIFINHSEVNAGTCFRVVLPKNNS